MRHTLLVAAITLALGPASALAQVIFHEDFRPELTTDGQPAGTDGVDGCYPGPGGAGTYPFPPDWLKRNVDNGTPAANVAYVNEAWEVREDFSFDVKQCVAFSTSWYSPAGAANDWMWTPAIAIPAGGANLTWRAVTYDASYRDGYEVRVMTGATPTGGTGVIGNQITNSTVVFSTAAENTAWTERTVDLAAYSGQSVYVGFRNNSVDKFLLLIDDVKVVGTSPNLTATSPKWSSPYSRVPSGLAYTPSLGIQAHNTGGSALSQVNATATLVHGSSEVPPSTTSDTMASLTVGATAPMVFTGSLGAMNLDGSWTVRYDLAASESGAETDSADNTSVSLATMVGGSELSRHEGAPTGTLGMGADTGGELGPQFTIPEAATFVGVRFEMGATDVTTDPEWLTYTLSANLRAFDSVTNKPGDIIATTVAAPTSEGAQTYDLAFATGPQALTPGTYVVTVNEPVGANGTLKLYQYAGRFEADTQWVIWPGAPGGTWANVEDFGAAYARASAVSLITSLDLFGDGFEPGTAPARVHGASSTPGKNNGKTDATLRGFKTLRLASPGH